MWSRTPLRLIRNRIAGLVSHRSRMSNAFRQLGLAAAVATAAFVWPAASAENIPDFSGRWGRNAFNFEPLPGGPQPVTNVRRLPSGIGDPNALVGDYNNPILRPEA